VHAALAQPVASGFSIPRVAVPATLLLTAGDRRRGQIYVMERVPHHSGPETPLEMLNRADGFFPFRPEDNGTILLVSKAHTIMLSVAADDTAQDPARLSAAKLVGIELTFVDGMTLPGFATAELPEYHSRPLDYLNASPGPFFSMSAGEEFHFVNRTHVLYARPQE
jgi:hypothetical protein